MRARLLSVVMLLAMASRADAQTSMVLLELRPREGDTVRMRLDQTTEMIGARRGSSARQVVTTLTMFSRAIVEGTLPASALITAITDSVDLVSNDEHARALAREAQRQLEGRQMRLRLSPDGTVAVADQQTTVPREVTDLVSVMPASFPREMIAVGATWERAMPIPPNPAFGIGVGWLVRSTFRLDSLTENGNYAFVSMRGAMEDASRGARSLQPLEGSVVGRLIVNRQRGWLAESRFQVDMLTTIAVGDADGKTAPMQFRMRITQHMRVFDRR